MARTKEPQTEPQPEEPKPAPVREYAERPYEKAVTPEHLEVLREAGQAPE